KVRPQHGGLVGVRDLMGLERLAPTAEAQLTAARGAEVPNPLRLAPRRDEVARALVLEEIHDGAPPGAALAAADGEDPRSVHADAEPRERVREAVEERISPGRPQVAPLGHHLSHDAGPCVR